MTATQKALPIWILIISGFFALMEIMVSVAICFSPHSVLETADLEAEGVSYLMYVWASRQFALGIMFAFATYKKSIPMLTAAYVFFFVMFAGDLVIGVIQKENPLVISAVVMCAASALLIFRINKAK